MQSCKSLLGHVFMFYIIGVFIVCCCFFVVVVLSNECNVFAI